MSDESVSGGQTPEEALSALPSPPVEPVTFSAVKHGIFSVSAVVPWFACEADWLAFRDSIF